MVASDAAKEISDVAFFVPRGRVHRYGNRDRCKMRPANYLNVNTTSTSTSPLFHDADRNGEGAGRFRVTRCVLLVVMVAIFDGCVRRGADGTKTQPSQTTERAVATCPSPQEWAERKRFLFAALQRLDPGDSYERAVAVLGRPIKEEVLRPKPPKAPIIGFSASYSPYSPYESENPYIDLVFDPDKRLTRIDTNMPDLPSLRIPIILTVYGRDESTSCFVVHQGESRELEPGERFDDAIKREKK